MGKIVKPPMHTLRYLLLSAGLFMLCSCERLLIAPAPATDAYAIFDEAWNYADRSYAFFEYKNINWNETRERYRSRIKANTNSIELFDILAEMFYELRDGHVNLVSPFDRSRNWSWYLNSPQNFDYSLLERQYFKQKETYVGPFVVVDFGDVGYVYYNSFSRGVSARSMDYIFARFAGRKGLIIDVRNNGGGSIENVNNIAGRFTSEKILAGRERVKNGPGHNDFSAFEELFIEPIEERGKWSKPVIVLTNRSSYSATNFFTMYMQALPQVTVIGDTTGGGGGGPAFTELANGWLLRVSATQTFMPDGFNVENGIPPDYQLNLDPADQARGLDTILEEALSRLR